MGSVGVGGALEEARANLPRWIRRRAASPLPSRRTVTVIFDQINRGFIWIDISILSRIFRAEILLLHDIHNGFIVFDFYFKEFTGADKITEFFVTVIDMRERGFVGNVLTDAA